MKQMHAIAVAAASAALLGLGAGVASAQTVSGADPYQQGYAAGILLYSNTINPGRQPDA